MTVRPVTPTLMSIIVCDYSMVDAHSYKRSLIGIFQNIRAQSFPCFHHCLHVYACVTDAQGLYRFGLKLIEVNTGTLLWEVELPPVTIKDRLQMHEIPVRITPLRFPNPGRYEFQLHANGELLGLRPIHLELQAPSAQQQQPPAPPRST